MDKKVKSKIRELVSELEGCRERRLDTIFSNLYRRMFGYHYFNVEDVDIDIDIGITYIDRIWLIGSIYEFLYSLDDNGVIGNKNQEDGVFYTPYDIVDLMCNLSLIETLKNKLGIEEVIAERIINNREICVDRHDLDRVLRELRICDPATGVGYFLIVMLDKILNLRRLCRVDSDYSIVNNCLINSLFGYDIDSYALKLARMNFDIYLRTVNIDYIVDRLNLINRDFLLEEVSVCEQPSLFC